MKLAPLLLAATSASATPLLWPQAAQETRSASAVELPLAAEFSWELQPQNDVVAAALERWTSSNAVPAHCAVASKSKGAIVSAKGTITVADADAPLIGANESYSLRVGADGAVAIAAATPWGALHALASLDQLVIVSGVGSCPHVSEAPFAADDEPRFAHRGVMLDPARNFLPVELLRKVVDGLAALKLNVLHLDLVNAPSFPFAAPSAPQFAAAGAYSAAETYGADELLSLTRYAAERGVFVLYEVDTPGHAYSWGLAAPDLITCGALEDQNWPNCPEPPCGYLDMRSADAVAAVQGVLGDVIDLVAPNATTAGGASDAAAVRRLLGAGAPVHIGADEVSTGCFGDDDTAPLFDEWVAAVKGTTRGRGAPTVAWMEAWSAMGASALTPSDSTLQFWGNAAVWDSAGGPASVAAQHEQLNSALEAGFDVVYSNASAWYLDCGVGNFLTGGLSWCEPFKSWQMVLSQDPTANVSAAREAQVRGGEVALWGEQIDETNLEPHLWQRAAAAAERLWAPAAALADCSWPVALPLEGCWQEAQDRLRTVQAQFKSAGYGFAPSQPKFCALHPEICDAYH